MFKGCIYRHWIVLDGVETSYIGLHKGTNPKKDRWGRNGKGYKPRKGKESTDFYKAILEYGWENFNHEIIGWVEAETMEQLALDLDEWEKYYIWKYDSFHNGFNSTTGGSGGMVVSEETKQKQREVAKQREANKSEEEKKQFSEKVSEAIKQARANMSDEKKKQWSEKLGKSVVCLETRQVFTTIKEADRWGKGNVSKCLKGKSKFAGKHPETSEKLHWMYYSDYLEQQQQNKDDQKTLATQKIA